MLSRGRGDRMAFPSIAVANEFVALARTAGKPLTPLQLQKLLYYAHGWSLALFDRPLLNEQIEAWKYGPVVPSVYKAFKRYGNQPIQDPATIFSPELGERIAPRMPHDINDADTARQLIARVFKLYGHIDGLQLSAMAHAPDTPWSEIYQKYGGEIPEGTDIPKEALIRYFNKIRAGAAPNAN